MAPVRSLSMPVPIRAGVFKGSYGPHGTELIHLRYHEESGTVFFSGTKVTGDPNVPVGKQTFVGDLSKDSLFMQLENQVGNKHWYCLWLFIEILILRWANLIFI